MRSPVHLAGSFSRAARRMLEFASILSLDVVAGALLSGWFAATVAGVLFPAVHWLVLGLSVWIIYTTDHLVDAYRLGLQAHTVRHRFTHRHFKVLAILVMALAFVAVALVILFLERKVLYFGMACGILAAIYLALLWVFGGRPGFPVPREAIVAILYTAGVWGVPLIDMPAGIHPTTWIMAGGFFLLALANTLVLSHADRDTDLQDRHQSFAVTFGRSTAARAVCWLCAGGVSCGVLVLISGRTPVLQMAGPVYILMALAMMLLVRLDLHSSDPLLFRVLTEAVFWMPGLLLLA